MQQILGLPVAEPKPGGDRVSANLCTRALKRPKGEIQIVETDSTPDMDSANEVRLSLLSRVARGRALANEIIWNGKVSLNDICKREACTPSYLYDILRAGCLAPQLVDRLVDGGEPNTLTSKVFKDAFPIDWTVQLTELT